MTNHDAPKTTGMSTCPVIADDQTWLFVGLGDFADGSCFIAENVDGSPARVIGRYDGKTGDVFSCDLQLGEIGTNAFPEFEADPAVHVIGALDDSTGQITVRQPEGNYLRICRWDRLEGNVRERSGADIRTLPQCGCGGSLGVPKLFDSFPDMCAYYFCTFFK